MPRIAVLCVVTFVTVALATPRAPALGDSRCDALSQIVPATVGAVTGDLSGAARHARLLRDLSTRELVPQRVKPALRRLARFFERAPNLTFVARAEALGRIASPLTKIISYAARTCPGLSTTTTSGPLR